VEVLSPSESAIDMHRKVPDYIGAGSQEVWVLDHVNGERYPPASGQRRFGIAVATWLLGIAAESLGWFLTFRLS